MKWQNRYLLLLIFVLIVIIGMFFIYSNIRSTERIEYLKGEPSWWLKIGCYTRGGSIELIGDGLIEKDCLIAEKDCLGEISYICHLH